jgi:hypothetical protein
MGTLFFKQFVTLHISLKFYFVIQRYSEVKKRPHFKVVKTTKNEAFDIHVTYLFLNFREVGFFAKKYHNTYAIVIFQLYSLLKIYIRKKLKNN